MRNHNVQSPAAGNIHHHGAHGRGSRRSGPNLGAGRHAQVQAQSQHRLSSSSAISLWNAASNQSRVPVQAYEGAINTVGIDLGVSEGGRLAWAVFGPASGVPYGSLAGEYVGASGDIGIGLGAGANVLVGGSNRSIALQPVSLEGSVALNVVARLSQLKIPSGATMTNKGGF